MINYDESKRQLNLRKHGIDLAELEGAFDFPLVDHRGHPLRLWRAAPEKPGAMARAGRRPDLDPTR